MPTPTKATRRCAILVLSRLKNEDIIIGGNILVRVLEVRGGVVRLGIEAPEDVKVHRREIAERDDGPKTWRADASLPQMTGNNSHQSLPRVGHNDGEDEDGYGNEDEVSR